jgi:hypothetical protein
MQASDKRKCVVGCTCGHVYRAQKKKYLTAHRTKHTVGCVLSACRQSGRKKQRAKKNCPLVAFAAKQSVFTGGHTGRTSNNRHMTYVEYIRSGNGNIQVILYKKKQ